MALLNQRDLTQDSDEVHEMHCEQCEEFDESADAEGFCMKCLEYMCKSCLKYHSRQNKQHKLQDREAMPQDFCFERCDVHINKFIRFYCDVCETFACIECRNLYHTMCTDIHHAPTMAKGIECSEEFLEVRKEMDRISEDLTKTESKLNISINETDLQEKKFMEAIDMGRKDRKEHFEKQRNRLVEKFDEYGKNVFTQIQKEKKEQSDRLNKRQIELELNQGTREKEILKRLETNSSAHITKLQSLLAECSSLINDIKSKSLDLDQKQEAGLRCKLLMSLKTAVSDLRIQKQKTLDLLRETEELNSGIEDLTECKTSMIQTPVVFSDGFEERIETIGHISDPTRNKKENENYLNQVFQSRDDLEKKYRAENEHLQQKYQEEMRAKEDALRRLSSMTFSKLRYNNPNIADLSDQNRPSKITEKFSELYDNQWTDAYDTLERDGMDQRQIIQTLLDALMTIYDECRRMSSENFFERVQRSIELPAEANEIPIRELALSDQLKQQIKEFRKTRVATVAKDIEKVLKPRIQLAKHQAVQVQGFLSHCVEICWLCTVQDPPLVLTAKSSRGFDTNMFKEYTKRGRYVEYVVWPVMYLHEGGDLLAKGVAQGIDHVQTSTKDDSNRKQPLHALPNAPVQEAFVRKTSDNKRERRNNPPTTFPDQQRQFSLVQSHHSSSSKTGTQSYTQKSQTVYSTRRTNVTTVDVKQGHGTAC